MSIEIKPGDTKTFLVGSKLGLTDAMERVKQLLRDAAPSYEKVLIYNRTKTCKVDVRFNGALTLVIEVTNEEEDSKFRLTVETEKGSDAPQTSENPKTT